MKSYLITACVLWLLALQSCIQSKSEQKARERASAQLSIPKSANTFNGIALDTTVKSVIVFIENVDDTEAMAYGHMFQFNNAETTELSVAIPYGLLQYDEETKVHTVNIKEFLYELNNGKKANMFVNSKQLAGHTYSRTDSILNN